MVWIDNSAGATISVSISSVHTPGGATGFFPIEPGTGAWAKSHWQRSPKFNETAVILLGDTTVKVHNVRGDDFFLVFPDSFIQVRNAPVRTTVCLGYNVFD